MVMTVLFGNRACYGSSSIPMLTFRVYEGGDHNLAVIMGGYQPTSEIRCGGRISLLTTSCEDVLEDMPATTENEVFGPATDPTSQVLLPHIVQSGKQLVNHTSTYLSHLFSCFLF